ncbi:MAG: DUF92 domain-containing protein [Gemmatimonadales bacterium]
MPLRPIVGGIAAAIVVIIANRRQSLSRNGAIAALVLGIVCATAGWGWAALLISFFVSGTLLSRYQSARKADRMGGVVEKGGNRDAFQVLANGGVFSAAALATLFSGSPVWFCAGAGALGAAAADTWATEIGVLSDSPPRTILSRRTVMPGESGGVTVAGTLAALIGGVAMAVVAYLAGWTVASVIAALVGGISGSTIDSILGETLQVRRRCEHCEATTERSIHDCGTITTVAAGLPWMDNDVVNALSTFGGAIIGLLVYLTNSAMT